MTAQPIAPPRTTTRWGGAGLAAAGVLLLAIGVAIVVPLGDDPLLAVSAVLVSAFAQVVLLAATVVLAVGLRREGGVAGRSRLGAVALVVFGAEGVGYRLLPVVPGIPVGTVLQVVVVAAVVVAAIAVLRARVLPGAARWALVAVAAVHVVVVALQSAPGTGPVPVLEVLGAVVQPALLVVTGGLYASVGWPEDQVATTRYRSVPPSPNQSR